MGWEVRGTFKREGTYVYLWLILVDVWQKPTQYCKAIIFQLKINKTCLLAQPVKKPPSKQKMQIRPLSWEDTLENEWNGYPLQYSCLENSMERGAW